MCAPHAPVPTLPFSNYNNSIFPQQSRQSASEAREVLTHTRLERFKVAVEANDRRRCIPDPDWLCPWPDRYHPSSQRSRSCARPVPLLFHSSAVAAIQTYSCSPFTCTTASVSTSAIAITAGIPPAPTPASPPAPPLASQPAPPPASPPEPPPSSAASSSSNPNERPKRHLTLPPSLLSAAHCHLPAGPCGLLPELWRTAGLPATELHSLEFFFTALSLSRSAGTQLTENSRP